MNDGGGGGGLISHYLQFRGGDSVCRGGTGKTERPSFHNVIIIRQYQIQIYNQESKKEINHIQAPASRYRSKERGQKGKHTTVYPWKKNCFWLGLKTTKFRIVLLKNCLCAHWRGPESQNMYAENKTSERTTDWMLLSSGIFCFCQPIPEISLLGLSY